MMEAAVGIAVFLDDRAAYNTAVARYLNRVHAYIYLPDRRRAAVHRAGQRAHHQQPDHLATGRASRPSWPG